jgi:serine/threonine-protein kinase HipA
MSRRQQALAKTCSVASKRLVATFGYPPLSTFWQPLATTSSWYRGIRRCGSVGLMLNPRRESPRRQKPEKMPRRGEHEERDAKAPQGDAVDVYLDGRKVGVLAQGPDTSGSVSFVYDEGVLDDPTAAVSVRLQVRPEPYSEDDALACFENLLPEGDLRDVLARDAHRDRTDVVGLLGVFGGECAGALALWPSGTTPPTIATYRPCTAEDVRAAFEPASLERLRMGADLAAVLRSARLSMSGAQEKLVLYRRPPVDYEPSSSAPEYRLPVAGAPSTVLVKRERGRFPGLVQNEIACMEMISAADIPAASHTVCALDARVYETARFDRLLGADGSVRRLHAEDGCQLTGRRPRAKYSETGGPTYAELRTALRRYSADPLTDTERLFRWAVANLAIGNRDAHAKNISLLYHEPTVRRLAPVYDVVCTMAYRRLDVVLPLNFGGQHTMEGLTPAALAKASREFGFTLSLARELVAEVCDRIDRSRSAALHLAEQRAGAHPVLETLDSAVKSLTNATRRLLLGD